LAEEATLGMARLYSKDDDWTNAYGYWDAYLKNGTWTSARDEAKGQFAIAKEKAGPLPAAPVNESDPLLAQSGLSEIEKSLLRANKMVEEGQKPEAFEMLAKLIEAADKNENLSKEDSKALRKANVLQQDLAVELGLGARLVED
jgi:hypothetical protein